MQYFHAAAGQPCSKIQIRLCCSMQHVYLANVFVLAIFLPFLEQFSTLIEYIAKKPRYTGNTVFQWRYISDAHLSIPRAHPYPTAGSIFMANQRWRQWITVRQPATWGHCCHRFSSVRYWRYIMRNVLQSIQSANTDRDEKWCVRHR